MTFLIYARHSHVCFSSLQYILNVTPDLPNVFEAVGNYKYMQIPIADHWSQNLASHFPKAIEFIGEYRLVCFVVTIVVVNTYCKQTQYWMKIE